MTDSIQIGINGCATTRTYTRRYKEQYAASIMRRGWVAAILILTMTACGEKPEATTNTTPTATAQPQRTRQPAVAGLFYPKDRQELSAMIDGFLAAAPTNQLPNVKALICPHAGYPYSGPTAAYAYKLITGRDYETVVILAPSHYASFDGVSVPATDSYETPLGKVPVSEKAKLLAKQKPFMLEPKCFVQRPPWARIASKPLPPDGEDTPDTWEHSAEVQVPFLQKTLKQFKILPLVFGNTDPAAVAEQLAKILDDKTLVVASTDLSHYHPYDEAETLDHRTVKWICDLDIPALGAREAAESACGRLPVLVLMHLAKMNGWKPHLLDYRNSGDTAGDKSGVVGYAAVAFTSSVDKTEKNSGVAETKPTTPQPSAQFTADERKFLLDLARKTIQSVVAKHGFSEIKTEDVPARCKESKGCFVTLTEFGQLRGCIGNIQPAGPLYEAVMENAQSAALHDYRFSPVTTDEVDKLHIEISVLTQPEPLPFGSPEELLAKLQPHKDGVILKIGFRSATFLPQVWEQLPDKGEFLSHLSQKAGCEPNAWRGKDVSVSIYHVEAFEESK